MVLSMVIDDMCDPLYESRLLQRTYVERWRSYTRKEKRPTRKIVVEI